MRDHKLKTTLGKSIPAKSNLKTFMGNPFGWVINHVLFIQSIFSLGIALSLSFIWIFSGSAQGSAAYIRRVRVMEADKTGLQNPAGLAFSSRANAFTVVEQPGQNPPAATDIIKLAPFAHRIGSAQIKAQIKDPINMAFDNKVHRLLILQFPANQLLEEREKPDGSLDTTTLISYPVSSFGLQNPQGMVVDPESGTLFILDAVGPRIVRVEPGLDGSFDGAVFSEVNLKPSGLVAPRGLAFDPGTRHLYLVSPAEQKLYELTQTGQVVAYRDLSGFRLGNPQGLVFAPSGDQTDDPSQMSLYLADGGLVAGQILELSFTQPVAAAASSFTSSLVKTTNMAAISPPSPDPDGLVYLPPNNSLIMSDSEVEEIVGSTTHFQGANLWELTLNGSVLGTANISTVSPTYVPMTNEPTGVTWDSANGHFFFSDDDEIKVWNLNPGSDGQIGTADDTWTSFNTSGGNNDPEDVTYDSLHDQLFVVDGDNREIYQYSTSGSLLNHFDVLTYGVMDPEGVVFNPDSGTLFVLSNDSNQIIIETTLSGALVQTIDVSADNATAPAGLAYAPASDGSGVQHFYIVARGIDNNEDPDIIDGKMYEMTAPSSVPPVRTPTTTTITSDLTGSSLVGEPVTVNFSVIATPPGTGTPTGNVTVSDGTRGCTGTVAAGTCSITFTTAGIKALTATYAGDTNFSGSVSTPATAHTVDKANTTTNITTDSPDPSVVGQSVTINYSVAVTPPGAGTPTANVTVSDGIDSCTGTVAAGTCSITFTSPGTKMLTAVYAGNANFNGSTSATATHTVNKASTATTITSDLPDPSVISQSVTIHYSVAVTSPGSGTPTGSVTVTDGTQNCTSTVAAGTCSIAFTTIGTKNLTATYAGDTNFSTSTSVSVSHAVRAATTTAITTDSPDPSAVGEPATINYSVTVTPPGTGTPTGNVMVSDGTQSCTGTAAAGTCAITFTTAGTKNLTATYAGDTNFITSTSAVEIHVVSAASTTTVINSDSPDPSVVGQAVTVNYSVAVVAPGSGSPTSNVTVSDGTDSCTGTAAAGTCSITFSSPGEKTLTATYAGNANFNGSTSTTATHTVNKASTTTTITTDAPDPSVVSQAVTINYSVAVTSPGTGTPTGNVTVSDGTQSCTGTVSAGTCSITFTTAGDKSLTATYAGDANFSSSTSTLATAHIVNKATTTTTITSDSPDPSVVGQTITINYSVAVVAPGTGTPAGNVTVSDSTDSCTGTAAAGFCSIAFTTAGTKTLTATYAGNVNFNGSTSATAPHTVNKANTATTITSDSPDPSVVGQPVTINYSVAVIAPGSGTPTGSVIVSDGTQSCTGTVCSITFTSPGIKALTATYAGDANFNGSVSTPATAHTVNKINTTTTITLDLPDPSSLGQPVTIHYSVAVIAPGTGTPTGSVTVSDGTDSCTGTVADGSCSIAFTTIGIKTLTATYAGDDNYSGSISIAVPHTVIYRIYLPLVFR
jgi:hypothetical protein